MPLHAISDISILYSSSLIEEGDEESEDEDEIQTFIHKVDRLERKSCAKYSVFHILPMPTAKNRQLLPRSS